jgi:hypothetical protein
MDSVSMKRAHDLSVSSPTCKHEGTDKAYPYQRIVERMRQAQ